MRHQALFRAIWGISLGLARVSAEQVQFNRKPEKFGVALSVQSTSNGSEVYMHIEAPASHQWAAVGSGDVMDGSLMFVMYSGEDGHEVFLSVRSAAHGHHEPDEVKVDVEILTSGIDDGVMQAQAKWKLDDSKRFSGVDVASKKQPWIWAVGPFEGKDDHRKEANNMRSSENELEQHSSYGIFFADMTKAAQDQTSPPQISGTVNVSTKAQGESYKTLVVLHALLLGIAFVVVFPVGVIGLRFRWKIAFGAHWLTQSIGSLASFIGLALAIALSIVGVEYDDFTEAHQILGICVVAFLALQLTAGYWHHLNFKHLGRRTAVSYGHIWLGRIVIYGGMVNSILGFELDGSNSLAMGSVVVSLVFAGGMEYMAWRHRRKLPKTDADVQGESSSELMLSGHVEN